MADLSISLGIPSIELITQTSDKEGNIILTVKSIKGGCTCYKCGKIATKRYGYAPLIRIRHLSILDTPSYIEIQPVRYKCEYCGKVTTESYDWCNQRSKTTEGLDKYLSRMLINSTCADVAKKEQISYKTLLQSIDRQVGKNVDWSQYKELRVIGIDEISNKKGHQEYYTIISVVCDNNKVSVIAVLPDRKKETVKQFLESIPDELKKTVKTVCTDMYDGFVQSAIEAFGEKAVVIDRYHVAKLYRKQLDKLRIQEMQRLKKELSKEKYAQLEGLMWILRKKHECLNETDKWKLRNLYKYSPKLKQAHSFALKLTHVFNTHGSRKSSIAKINRWISKVEKSDITCFNSFITTLEKYKAGIVNYFKNRKNSGFVEGLNNKIKVAKRRCYGFFKVESLFQRLFLDLCGYDAFRVTN
jgi:transposase